MSLFSRVKKVAEASLLTGLNVAEKRILGSARIAALRARTLRRQKKWVDAAKAFEAASDRVGGSAKYLHSAARCWGKSGLPLCAITALESAIELSPAEAGGHLIALSRAYRKTGRHLAELNTLRAAASKAKETDRIYAIRRLTEYGDWGFLQGQQRNGRTPTSASSRAAPTEWTNAQQLVNGLDESTEEYFDALIERGRTYESLNMPAAALADYASALNCPCGKGEWAAAPDISATVSSAELIVATVRRDQPTWVTNGLRLATALRCKAATTLLTNELARARRLTLWQRAFVESLLGKIEENAAWLREHGYTDPDDTGRADDWTSGTFSVSGAGGRLKITGATFSDFGTFFILINYRILRAVNVHESFDQSSLHLRLFNFNLNSIAVAALPKYCRLSLGTLGAPLVTSQYRDVLDLQFPEGTGRIISLIRTTHTINKHGGLESRITTSPTWQRDALQAYRQFSEYFLRTFGYELFIVYGVLLGAVRDGDFIASDDDFDIAYFSKHTTPREVKRELLGMIDRMHADGYWLASNPLRRMFKVRINECWLDCFSGWYQKGRLWMPQTTSFEAPLDIILPLKRVSFKGTSILVPNKPELFVESVYGPQWRLPDPGYRAPKRPPELLQHIKKCYLSAREMTSIVERGVMTPRTDSVRKIVDSSGKGQ